MNSFSVAILGMMVIDASAVDELASLELVNLNGNRLERFPELVGRMPQHLWQDNPGTRRYWAEQPE